MRTPKKWLQDWLGITSIAHRVSEIDIRLTPSPFVDNSGINNESIKLKSINYTVSDTWTQILDKTDEDTTKVKKGYES